jgi:hyperosmotically inducible protein
MKTIALLVLGAFILFEVMTPAFADKNPADEIAKDVGNLVKDTGNLIQDGVIAAAVTTKLSLDKNLSTYDIDTVSHDGVVTLTGTVNSDSEKNKIIEIASATNGVKAVDASQLKVKPDEQPIKDAEITTKIKAKYLKEKIFGDADVAAVHVEVETKNGIVYLSGKVDNATEAQNAISIAKSVSGVSRVESTIVIVKE